MNATPEQRSEALAQAVAREVASGWRVESQTATNAVVVKGKHVSHGFHLFLSVITFGMWAPVWIASAILNRRQAISLDVDLYGNLRRQVL